VAVACQREAAPDRLLELAARNVLRRYATREDALAALR
jgi:hypothetical protein